MSEASVKKTLNNIEETIIELMKESALPGLAVGVVKDGELVYSQGFGYANIEKKIPVTADTVFRIMSISKTFTGIGLMQLFEEGQFELDDPVNAYLRSYQIAIEDKLSHDISFRHLMTHTSGLGETRNIWDVFRPVVGLAARPDSYIQTMGDYYHGRLHAEIPPGEKWCYANHAFATLAQLIEEISGQPFSEYMLEHVFEPLGMLKSDYILSERVRDQLAQGYEFKKDRFKQVEYLRLATPGCGGVFSSVNEMSKYMAMLMNKGALNGTQILKPETLEMMMTAQLETDPRVFGMGLTFFLSRYGRHSIVHHDGGWPGFISSMQVAPEAGLGVVVFTNSSSRIPHHIAAHILRSLLGVKQPMDIFPDDSILEARHLWSQFCGTYGPSPGLLTNFRTLEHYGGEVQVMQKGSKLILRGVLGETRKGIVLHRCEAKDPMIYKGFFQHKELTALFKTDEQGNVDRMELDSDLLYKRSLKNTNSFKLMAFMGSLVSLVLFAFGLKKYRK
ncbi:MAG: beta-lactamase family protein [Anaerolineaceae bacterium]|nr:beta-lactamase family protein [Anaerolineaceae bacterium]